jgi:hypothetical protein
VFRRAAGLRDASACTIRVSANEALAVDARLPTFEQLRREYSDVSIELMIDNTFR